MDFEVKNLRDGYVDIVRGVWNSGDRVAPRGQPTREVLNATIKLHDPTDALPFGVGRNLKPAIGAAEALQLVGGFTDPQLMVRITGNFTRFMDGGVLMGAYGPRIRTQLPEAVRRLREDPDTRQAVVLVWDPLVDGFGRVPKDLPCTLGFQFVIRDGRLSMLSKMRSQDCYLGLAYDLFMFAQLQLAVANVLGLPPGPLYHSASSLHIYERDEHKIGQLHPYVCNTLPAEGRVAQRLHGLTGDTVQDLQDLAIALWGDEPLGIMTDVEVWYRSVLGPYLFG